MRAPILTLTTDFGLSDHYVGSMKGVILGICPRAQLVDISHQVSRHAIAEGAFVVAQAYRSFPPGTVHVVVVDPGVGSQRRPILMEAAGQYFIAPDNGVLAMVFAREKHKVRLISNARYFHRPVSQTFHGRDIFAPVAAHVAAETIPSAPPDAPPGFWRPAWRPRASGRSSPIMCARPSSGRGRPASAHGRVRFCTSTTSATSSPISTATIFPRCSSWPSGGPKLAVWCIVTPKRQPGNWWRLWAVRDTWKYR